MLSSASISEPIIGPRAFGGAVLAGERVVRLVYIDEAGISNPKQEPYLVVSGVIVHADHDLIAVERHLERIVRRHIPEEFWPTFVFHATHLFNWGGPVFTKNNPDFPLSKRLEIARELAAIPKAHGLGLALGFVERDGFMSHHPQRENMSPAELVLGQHATAFVVCALVIERWMRRNTKNEVCMLVVEDNQHARKYLRDAHQFYQNANVDKLEGGDDAKQYLPMRKIKEDPLFQEKRPGSVLQLADFTAYVFKRWLMRDRRYDPLMDLLGPQMVAVPPRPS